MKNSAYKHFPIRIQGWIRVSLTARPMVKWIILLTMIRCTASVDVSIQADVNDLCRCRYQSGQALFSPLKLRSEGLVPASAAPCADADFHSHLPRRRDSSSSCPRGSQEAKETLQGPHTPAHEAPAQWIPARPAMASSGSCAASG